MLSEVSDEEVSLSCRRGVPVGVRTLNGMTRYVPKAAAELAPDVRAAAGVDQAVDLLDRSESSRPSAISERDYLRRAIVQLDATEGVALDAGIGDVAAAAAAAAAAATAMESLDAAVAALDAGDPHGDYVDAAREALNDL